jgi:predicted nucleic acid-binding Zn ribbon protein
MKMFCSKCGVEITDGIQFCSKCGNVVNSTSMDTENIINRKRHGFTSFWLIFSLISYVIVGSIYLFSPELIAQSYNASNGLIMLFGIVSIAGIIGNIFLLCWKKIGFWVFIGVAVVSLILNFVIGMNIGQILFGLVGIPIMWGILHIRKNGKTTWEQLV